MNDNLPERKVLRYKHFDYNEGVVFITICTLERKQILSNVVSDAATSNRIVWDGALDVPKIQLTEFGKIVEKHIISSNQIKGIKVLQYVIMPNHIHILVSLSPHKRSRDVEAPSPTNKRQNLPIPNFVSSLKRFCNKEIGENIFQRSYYDHVIRSDKDLDMHIDYILHNPENWYFDELYSDS